MKAEQKFTFFCKNSIAWFDTENNDYSRALSLLGDNEFEFEGEKLKPKDVPFDGCRVRMSLFLKKKKNQCHNQYSFEITKDVILFSLQVYMLIHLHIQARSQKGPGRPLPHFYLESTGCSQYPCFKPLFR